MATQMQNKLTEYYKSKDIHPEYFHCQNQKVCRSLAYEGIMTEAKMSMVGTRYGIDYPKLVVVSLDPPSGENKKYTASHQRTTEYVSSISETDNFEVERLNPHWAMTQIIIKDIITLFGYRGRKDTAIVVESYSGRLIENVSAFFAHVNVAKCSMNNPGRGQASQLVHEICSNSYLAEEISILEPDILITQGKTTNQILGKMLVGYPLEESDLPKSEVITFRKRSILWLPMHHPTRQLNKIREEWPKYFLALKKWRN